MSFQQYISGLPSIVHVYSQYKQPASRLQTMAQLETAINQILVQVALTLDYAQSLVQFMHLDLHLNNVLMRPVEGEVDTIVLQYRGMNVKLDNVSTQLYKPAIIDYGFAVCTVRNEKREKVVLVNRWPCEHADKRVKDIPVTAIGNGVYNAHYFAPLLDFTVYLLAATLGPMYVISTSGYGIAAPYRAEVIHVLANVARRWVPYLQARLVGNPTVSVPLGQLLSINYADNNVLLHASSQLVATQFKALKPLLMDVLEGFFRTTTADNGGSLLDWIKSAGLPFVAA